MSTSHTKVHLIQMPICQDFQVLVCRTDVKSTIKEKVIMTYIDENDEKALDKNKELRLTRGNKEFVINEHNIFCYGIVDYKLGSDDSNVVATFNFLNHLNFAGRYVPANYNYDSHTCTSNEPSYKHYETWHPEVVAQYCHGALGKPKRTVLFRQIC